MATNYIGPGDVIDVTAGATISSGDVVEISEMVGIAQIDGVSGDIIPCAIVGVHNVTCASATDIAQGDLLDWDTSASQFDKIGAPASGDIVACGVAVDASGNGDTDVHIKLTPGTATLTP